MADRIDDLVGQEAYEQVIKLDKMMGDLVTKFDLTAKSALSMQAAIGDTKKINEIVSAQQRQSKSLDEIEKLEKKLTETMTLKAQLMQEIKLKQQEEVLNNKAFIKGAQAAEGSINQLRLQLNQATKAYDAMGKAERESGKGTTLLTNIQNTTTALKQLEANTGRFQRNVGNYTGATFQLTQVMRELPNFAQSAEIGIRSLSNNLPMLADSFGQVRKEAGGTLPALKIFGASLFSFAGLFPIVLGLLISYSSEIMDFVKGTDKASEATMKFREEMSKSIGTQIGEIERLSRALKSEELSNQAKLEIAKQLIETYPKTLANYTAEEIAAGKASKAIDTITQSLKDLAIAKAGQAELEKEAGKLWTQEQQREKLKLDLAKAQAEQTKADLAAERAIQTPPTSESGFRVYDAILKNQTKAENAVISIQEEMAKLDYEISQTNKSMDKLATNITKINRGAQRATPDLIPGGGGGTTTSGTTRTKAAPKEKREPDVLEKMQRNLAQLSLESKASMKEGIEDNMKEASKLMAAKLTELQKQVNENGLTLTIEWTNADKFEAFIENATPVMEAINGIVQNFQAATQDLVSIGTDKIQRDAEAELEAIDATTEAELEAIDRLTISETEREERKKKVEIEAETRRRNIERKKVQDLQKFARMQKAADVLAITSATALAVMKQLSVTPLPAGAPFVAAVAIAGAAQLAAVLARPLPQYELGTPEGGHIGGKAIVGEAGAELGIRPDGSMFLTPSKASIMDLPKRTEIIPHDITKDLLGATMVRLAQANQAVTLDMYQDELIEEFKRGTDKIANEIRKNRTNISIGSSFRDYVKYNQL